MAFSHVYVSCYFGILYSNTKLNNLIILIQTLTPFHNYETHLEHTASWATCFQEERLQPHWL